MKKIREEMPSNPQQNHLGMESNASIALGPTTVGAGCRNVAAGCSISNGNTGGCSDGGMERLVLMGNWGVIAGGDRRGGMAGVRAGRGIRAVSCFTPSFQRPGVVSGFGGNALRTGSFLGSAMTDHVASQQIAENPVVVTLTFHGCDSSGSR